MNTMSVVPLLVLRPHWLSERFSSAKVGTSLFCRTLASTFPMMKCIVIPQ